MRLKACLPDWLPAYEADHRRLNADVRQALLQASRATLDDRHGWRFDAVDIHTPWKEMRARPNHSEAATLLQIRDVEASLPFPLRGLDSDNGGECINHHLVQHLHGRQKPVAFTRSRPDRKNDQAHIEQKNYTPVRWWFGYERYDNPAVVSLINARCKGQLNWLLNYFRPTMKLKSKERVGSKVVWKYGPTPTPLSRVLACAEVSAATKERLRTEKPARNPFALTREVARQMNVIEANRRQTQA